MELVQADIDAYLATKHADDVIGERYNSMFCLLSESLHHKYPTHEWRVESYRAYGLLMEEPYDMEEIELSQEMREVEVNFDLLPQVAPRSEERRVGKEC